MQINWYGEGCFKIQTGGLTIVTDPYDSSIGLTPPRGKTDITIKTLMPTTDPATSKPVAREESDEQIISGPGEYEIKGVVINGWQLAKDSSESYLKSVFTVETEEMRLGFLGHISEFNEPEIIEELDGIDILFIPAGGKPFLEQEAAGKLIRQIDPKVVVCSFFKTPGLKRKADDVAIFLKDNGYKATEQEKLTIKKKELTDKLQVVVLKNER
ncbi:MAG: MBL fold metallo-hydrolase [bacterium]|nr:MBL fold metallo-hydrolase [bacterium]